MIPNRKYQNRSKVFWAQVKLISMTIGYSKKGGIITHSFDNIVDCFGKLNLETKNLFRDGGEKPSEQALLLVDYFKYRSKVLHNHVEKNLMKREEAKKVFEKVYNSFKSTVPIPYNKQKGDKRHHAYLTGLISLLTEKTLGGVYFDYDPREVVVITKNKKPIQALTRRIDGAYPSPTNPIAIWEIKEYYDTTTFGSRVADGVYETMLDGYEIEELKNRERLEIKHYLIIDDHFTWWDCGKSYLCRIIDMIHEGFVDEVLFGKEVVKRWPEIVKSWPKVPTTSTASDRERLLHS